LNNYPNLSNQQQHAHLAHFEHNPKHHEDALARRQAQISQTTSTFDDCLPPQVGKYVDLQLLEAPSKSKHGGFRNKQNSKRGGKSNIKQSSIDSIPGHTGVSKVFQNYKSTCYKATCLDDGVIYFIRRIHNIATVDDRCLSMVNAWRGLHHSGIVELKEVFTSDQFEQNEKQRSQSSDSDPAGSGFILNLSDHPNTNGNTASTNLQTNNDLEDSYSDKNSTSSERRIEGLSTQSLIFVHEYYSNAKTIEEKHFKFSSKRSKNKKNNQKNEKQLIPEQQIWSYTVQLTSVLRHIHTIDHCLAYRCLDASKILIVSENRIKLSSCAVQDVLNYCITPNYVPKDLTSPKIIETDRTEDQRKLGFLLLALACNYIQREVSQSDLELVCQNYSEDLFNVIIALLGLKKTENGQIIMSSKHPEVTDTMPYIGARFYTHLENSFRTNDQITKQLEKHCSTGRLFRSLMKICSICERPAKSISRAGFQSGYESWAETDQRYLIKLFRDYLFHSVDEQGRPWMNLNHVVCSLNKVDCGSREKITLTSRDEQNMFIVTFADIKRALDHSFSELMEKSSPLAENSKKESKQKPAVNPNATSFTPQSMQIDGMANQIYAQQPIVSNYNMSTNMAHNMTTNMATNMATHMINQMSTPPASSMNLPPATSSGAIITSQNQMTHTAYN
jgi:PAB-dependent poly(A)-specific ribonuclease subunit 3